jgi:N-acetylglucosaminyl-diphospho-decaprenol L-rhamnosyltransferase
VRIDVVIPSWNKAELLAGCLDHLAEQTVAYRAVVADNGSEDGTLRMLRERFPHVTVVELGRNLGFGRAVNRAVAAGDGEVLVVLNNDVDAEPSFLAEMIAPFEDESVGMVSGVLVEPGTGLIDAAGVEIDRGLGGYAYMGGLPPSELDRPRAGLLGPCGGAAAYRRAAFESIDGFDERIFVYSEDLELALRLHDRGWRCALAPGARGIHLGSATLGARTVKQVSHSAWSRGYVMGRYRVGAPWMLAELVAGTADALLLRSLEPLRRRVRGWREGRALPARSVPSACRGEALSLLPALRRRLRAASPRA